MRSLALLLLCLSCAPPSPEPTRISATLEEFSAAGAAFGLSNFHGDGLGNLTLGKTTFGSFRGMVSGRAFRPEAPYLVYEFPPNEYERAELRAVALRFASSEFPPPHDALLSEIILTLPYKAADLPLILKRLGGEFEEVPLPAALNRYGEVSASTYFSRNAPYAVDVDRTGIRIFARLPRPKVW